MSSLKKFFESKNASILNPEHRGTQDEAGRRSRAPARTAPGALLAFNTEMVEAEQREQALRDELQKFEGALPVKRLPPEEIKPSRWANRNEASFAAPAFERLKREIEAAGENVQPIKVRPIAADGAFHYELVYGQRRHRACAELGIPVNAMIQEMTDQQLFLAMDRENRARADLSPYELGMHYRRALDAKLWPSQNLLAKEAGVTQAHVSQALTLAALPREVVQVFPSVLDLQVRWGVKLAARLETEKATVLSEAKKIAQGGEKLSARLVFERLMGGAKMPVEKAVEVGGKVVARYGEQGGQLVIRFTRGAISPDRMDQIPAWIGRLFNDK